MSIELDRKTHGDPQGAASAAIEGEDNYNQNHAADLAAAAEQGATSDTRPIPIEQP